MIYDSLMFWYFSFSNFLVLLLRSMYNSIARRCILALHIFLDDALLLEDAKLHVKVV
nr:hypothetical protein Itr_chr04CG17920 [Ipomoea trifida]GLL42005.1 hypothetical protein Itr_chr12CG16140 [Ipomoea trifida]